MYDRVADRWLALDTRFDLEFGGGSGDDDRLTATDTFGGNERGTNFIETSVRMTCGNYDARIGKLGDQCR